MKTILSTFIIIALYTPALWVASIANWDQKFSFLQFLSIILMITPLFVFHYIKFEDERE